jgi:hypothetical protein
MPIVHCTRPLARRRLEISQISPALDQDCGPFSRLRYFRNVLFDGTYSCELNRKEKRTNLILFIALQCFQLCLNFFRLIRDFLISFSQIVENSCHLVSRCRFRRANETR